MAQISNCAREVRPPVVFWIVLVEMADRSGNLLIRIHGKDSASGVYPVEAQLDDGSVFSGGSLSIDAAQLKAIEDDPREYGLRLSRSLFSGSIRSAYDKATGTADAKTEGRLRVRLWIDDQAPELNALKWERLLLEREGQTVPLASSVNTPFSRYTGLAIAQPAPVSDRPLRFLLVVSNPLGLPAGMVEIDVEREIQAMAAALLEMQRAEEVEATFLPGRTGLSESTMALLRQQGFQVETGPAALENILRLLQKRHVFHFLGHGRFKGGAKSDEAALDLEDEDGSWRPVTGVVLASKIGSLGEMRPCLTFLAACESAKGDDLHPFAGVGPRLVQAGAPAVVAMQERVSMDLARQLTGHFYRCLLEHGRVDLALNQARHLLRGEGGDWATPVLFSRLQDNRLLVPAAEAHAQRFAQDQVPPAYDQLKQRVWEHHLRQIAALRFRELDRHPTVEESPLIGEWRKLAVGEAWHRDVGDRLEAILEKCERIPESDRLRNAVSRIDCSRPYLQILDELMRLSSSWTVRPIEKKAREIEKEHGLKRAATAALADGGPEGELKQRRILLGEFFALQRMAENPRFRRCLMVMGRMGSGKTHSILTSERWLPAPPNEAEDEADDWEAPWSSHFTNRAEFLPILMPTAPEKPGLKENLLTAIREATGYQWASLDEFARYLNQLPSPQGETPRVVAIIDNFERWVELHGEIKAELDRRLESCSAEDPIHWVLTTGEASLSRFADQYRFWEIFSTATPEASQRRMRDRRSSLRRNSVSGWISLDALNREESFGRAILQRLMDESADDSFQWDVFSEERISELDNPLIAWLVWDLRDAIPIGNLVNLHFIEFVESFWSSRLARLADSGTSELILEQLVGILTRVYWDTVQDSIAERAVIQSLTQIAASRSELEDQVVARKALDAALEGGLLRRTVRPDPELAYIGHLELDNEIFWNFQFAHRLHQVERLFENIPDCIDMLQRWRHSQSGFLDGMLEFSILLIDKDLIEKTDAPGALADLVDGIFGASQLPRAPIWFGAAKSSEKSQSTVLEAAARHPIRLDDPEEVFARLYFLGDVSPSALPPDECLHNLKPLFPAILQFGYVSYMVLMVSRILQRVPDAESLLRSWRRLEELLGNGELEENSTLALMSVEALAELSDFSVQQRLDFVFDFLKGISPPQRRPGRWQRTFYREWILQFFLEDLIAAAQREDVDGVDLYLHLMDKGWFDGLGRSVHRQVALEMEREANLAFGFWYRTGTSPEERNKFQRMTVQLAEDRRPQKRKLAFYLIRHTVPTGGAKGITLDSRFREPLEKIALDPRLGRLVELYWEDFKANLEDFETLMSKTRRRGRKKKGRR